MAEPNSFWVGGPIAATAPQGWFPAAHHHLLPGGKPHLPANLFLNPWPRPSLCVRMSPLREAVLLVYLFGTQIRVLGVGGGLPFSFFDPLLLMWAFQTVSLAAVERQFQPAPLGSGVGCAPSKQGPPWSAPPMWCRPHPGEGVPARGRALGPGTCCASGAGSPEKSPFSGHFLAHYQSDTDHPPRGGVVCLPRHTRALPDPPSPRLVKKFRLNDSAAPALAGRLPSHDAA